MSIVCIYPKLIAAYHVLHRLLVPRHPPYALIRFKYCHPSAIRVNGEQDFVFTLLLVSFTVAGKGQKLLSQYVKELRLI